VRDAVALFSLVQGVTRIFLSASVFQVNILPNYVYGAVMLFIGFALLLTGENCWRATRLGRGVAILATGAWLLLTLDVVGAWASFGNAALITISIANEVRYRDAC